MSSHRYLLIAGLAVCVLVVATWVGRQRHQSLPVDDSRYFRDGNYFGARGPDSSTQRNPQVNQSPQYGRWSETTPEEREERLNRLIDDHVERLEEQADQYDALSDKLREGYLVEILEDEYERRARRRLQRWQSSGGTSAAKLLDDRLAELPPDLQERIRVYREALNAYWKANEFPTDRR